MSKVLSIGDILEISCKSGIGYASFAGRHPWLGDSLWLLANTFGQPRTEWSALFKGQGYHVFYPVHAALRQKAIKHVGFEASAMRPIPNLVRTALNKDANGAVLSWLITDGVSRTPRMDSELSIDERLLPIGSIWNHALLCERLETRWTP